MILVRNVFQAKFGKGGELAKLMIEGMRGDSGSSGGGGRWRVLTDLSSGPFDTVVIEGEAESLAAWEEMRRQMFSDPSMTEGMARTVELIQSGHAELYTIEGESGQ